MKNSYLNRWQTWSWSHLPEKIHLGSGSLAIALISSAPCPWNFSPVADRMFLGFKEREGEKSGIQGIATIRGNDDDDDNDDEE